MLFEAINKISENIIDEITTTITNHIALGDPVLVFGNGGSAAIAEHLSCDHMKGIRSDCVHLKPFVINLGSNQSLITAIANDYGYENIFSEQILWCTNKNALIIGISSSGNSPNIIKAFEAAKIKKYNSIAMIGFDGGKVLKNNLAEQIVHVPFDNYGIVEDCHQIIMHSIAQGIRLENSAYPSLLKL